MRRWPRLSRSGGGHERKNDQGSKKMNFKVDRGNWNRAELSLSSGCDEWPGCDFTLQAFSWRFTLRLPQWCLRPERKKVQAEYWDAATIERMGRDWYWDITERKYGFYLFDGHFNALFGRRSHDSRTEQRWSCFLPWTQWRHVRHSLYDGEGRWLCDMPTFQGLGKDSRAYHWQIEACKAAQPKAYFLFRDFDGEEIKARCCVEEREWRFGDKSFKWLSLFRKPQIRRSLDLWFSSEVGRKKGSWKGGTLGHGTEMVAGESPEAAFRRYCDQQKLTFLGPCDPWTDRVPEAEPEAVACAESA